MRTAKGSHHHTTSILGHLYSPPCYPPPRTANPLSLAQAYCFTNSLAFQVQRFTKMFTTDLLLLLLFRQENC